MDGTAEHNQNMAGFSHALDLCQERERQICRIKPIGCIRLFRRMAIVFFGATLIFASSAQPARNAQIPGNAVKGELVVRFKNGVTDAEIEHGLKLGRLKPKRHLQTGAMHRRGDNGITLVESDDPMNVVIERLSKHPAFEYVEPNLQYRHYATSNDPYIGSGQTWGMYGDLGTPANAYGSQASEAWAAGYTGSGTVFVAVIDEGIDIAHPDLAGNIWKNPFDPVDGRDNDGNGYVDDVNGWDFAANSRVVFNSSGDKHGTHVAGTIGAKGGNGKGVAGVNWNVTIIPGKFLGPDGGNTLDAVEAIDYFIDLKQRHGINLVAINASWGGPGYSRALHEAVNRAAKAGILFIAAAGNNGENNNTSASYPANLDTRVGTGSESGASYDAVISVAAISKNGGLADFSNYGSSQVDIGAPGVEILSTQPNGNYGYMNGTSMATPHVTGAAALYASTHPGASALAIRNALLGSVLPTASLSGKTTTGGRLNVSTIVGPELTAPASLNATAGDAVVNLSWSAVSGATSYVVQRGNASGGPYATIASSVTGTSYTDNSVSNDSTYYYVVAALNSVGTSGASREASASPKAPVTASTTYCGDDEATSGTWRGSYGTEGGFAYPYGSFTAPSYVTIGAHRNYPITWATSTSDERALQKASGSDRFAAGWHSTTYLYFFLNFTDGLAHEVSFYFVDYDRQGRDQILEFYDHVTGRLLGSERISGFENGRYSTWKLQGNVRVKLSRLGGPNCVMSAMFFDASGAFVGGDSVTSGSWKGAYASEGGLAYPYGYFVPPSYVQLSAYKNYGLLWAASTSDARALQKPTGSDRMAGAWHSSDQFHFNLQFQDNATHEVSLYFVDFDRSGRVQKLEIIDQSTGALLDSQIISDFGDGVYYRYQLTGNIRVRVTRLSGANCVMSAILFDPAE